MCGHIVTRQPNSNVSAGHSYSRNFSIVMGDETPSLIHAPNVDLNPLFFLQNHSKSDLTEVNITHIDGIPDTWKDVVQKACPKTLHKQELFIYTGAETSIMSNSRYEAIGPHKSALIRSHLRLHREWNGKEQSMPVLGDVVTCIDFNNGSSAVVRFHVVADGTHPILLGKPDRDALSPIIGYNYVMMKSKVTQSRNNVTNQGHCARMIQ